MGDNALDTLTDAMMHASRALVTTSMREVSRDAPDLTVHEYRSLVVLVMHGAQRPSDVATKLGTSKATATRLVDRMVAKGLFEKYQDPDDGRAMLCTLSEKGEALVTELFASRRAAFAGLFRDMPPAETEILTRALIAMARALGTPTTTRWP